MKTLINMLSLLGAVLLFQVASGCDYGGNMQPGVVNDGTTTRYWDCCKMSCSWDKGIPFINQPVKSCNTDGASGGSTGDSSICSGGFSGSCSDFQPWWDPAHPDLLFMFAAYTNGDNDCCSCVEMTNLSDGYLAGKTIVAQITNCGTGQELHNHQFDLQIPMSGVGVFPEGCPNQWGSNINFGQQFGGISDESECQQLYDAGNPLYIGCLFRFRSFMNADNPTMSYRRVQCPEVLTKLSGCSRSDDQCFPALEMRVPFQRTAYVDTDGNPLASYPSEGSGTTPPPSPTSSTSSTSPPTSSTSSTSPPAAPSSTSSTSTTSRPSSTSSTNPNGSNSSESCYTEVGYYPLSPLYCLPCEDTPMSADGSNVCNSVGNYAPCFADQASCFEGLRGIHAPDLVLSADDCFTAASHSPSSADDCIRCPAHPHYLDNGEWLCRELNSAPCFDSPDRCYEHLRSFA